MFRASCNLPRKVVLISLHQASRCVSQLIVVAAFVFLSASAHAENDPSAEVLLQAAEQSWSAYQRGAPGAATSLVEANGYLRQIIIRHPGSQIAQQLLAGNKVRGVSLADVQAALDDISSSMDVVQCLGAREPTCFLDLSERLVREIPNTGETRVERAVIQSSIGEAFAMLGQTNRARQVLSDALPSGRIIVVDRNFDRAIRIVFGAQLRTGFFDDSLRTATLLGETRDTHARFIDVVRAQAQAGLAEEAFSTADRVRSDWRTEALSEIPFYLARGGHIEMAQRAVSHLPVGSRNRVLAEIARVQASDAAVDDALATVRRIADREAMESAMAPVVSALIIAGRTAEAGDVLSHLENRRSRIEVLIAAAAAFHEIGEQVQAESALLDALLLLTREEQASFTADRLYRDLASSAARVGMFDFAAGVLENISRESSRRLPLFEIAELIAETGDLARAADIASVDSSTFGFFRLVAAAARGNPSDSTINGAAEIARAVSPSPSLRAQALLILANDHHAGTFGELADAMFEEAVLLVSSLSDQEQQARLLIDISLSPLLRHNE